MTQEELKEWIKFTQNRYIMNDVHSQWDNHKSQDGKLSWAVYRKDTYGFMTGKNTNLYFLFLSIICVVYIYIYIDTQNCIIVNAKFIIIFFLLTVHFGSFFEVIV